MAVATFTRTGSKAATPAKLDPAVFGVAVRNHELVKQAYVAYLANGRTNNAVTLERGEVRGGGRKPWRQKGTGRARFGSIRNPIWRGGGIVFGPTGQENYTKRLSTASKRQAIRQALTMAASDGNIMVIEDFQVSDGKTKTALALLNKLGATGRTMIVLADRDSSVSQSTSNLPNISVVTAKYLNVFNVMNADTIVLTKAAQGVISDWLGQTSRAAGQASSHPKTTAKEAK